jgi:hypothetical protein
MSIRGYGQVSEHGAAAHFVGHLSGALRVPAVHQDPGASRGESGSGDAAYSGRRPCDQHDRIGQLHRCRSTPP